jgi:hypothetical protein
MLDVNLVSAGRIRHYSVALTGDGGWEVMVEGNRRIQLRETLGDWRRVERTLTRFRHEVNVLIAQGWVLEAARGLM